MNNLCLIHSTAFKKPFQVIDITEFQYFGAKKTEHCCMKKQLLT